MSPCNGLQGSDSHILRWKIFFFSLFFSMAYFRFFTNVILCHLQVFPFLRCWNGGRENMDKMMPWRQQSGAVIGLELIREWDKSLQHLGRVLCRGWRGFGKHCGKGWVALRWQRRYFVHLIELTHRLSILRCMCVVCSIPRSISG